MSGFDRVRRPRVALFSGNYNCIADGANQALNRLVAHLERQGFAVRVYSPAVAHPAFAPSGTLIAVPSVPIPGRSEYRVAIGITPSVRADIDRFAPDLVHVSAPDLLGRAAQRYAAAAGVPLVASQHTRFETYFEYYGWSRVRAAGERYLARFYGRCDLVLAPNAPMAALLRRDGLDEARIGIWGRGVDRRLFDPARRSETWRQARGYGRDDPVVLFFGRLVREKGIADFADAIGLLRRNYPGLRPLVVGGGPAQDEFADRLSNACFTGFLRGEALAEAVASADILLNPSSTEAFGNVNLEAMAAGLAIVSADAPSSQQLINHGHSGLLCPAGDIAAYAKAVDGLLRDSERRARLGQAARAASAAFDWESALSAVSSAYRRLLGGTDRWGSADPAAGAPTHEDGLATSGPAQMA